MNLSAVDIIQLSVAVLAGTLVVWEQWKGKSPWKSWRLWIASALLLMSVLLVWVTSYSTGQLEKERKSDLLLIQKQNTALNSLWIEYHMQPHDIRLGRGCNMQIATYSKVASRYARTGQIAEYISVQYDDQKGWYQSKRYHYSWPNFQFEFDSTDKVVSFELSPFGIRSQSTGELTWRAERLADISLIRFQFQLGYGAELPVFDTASINTAPEEPIDLNWNPIGSICLYANSRDSNNLICRLIPRSRSYGNSHDVLYFFPENQLVTDSDQFTFYPDLLLMRAYILKTLD